MDTIVAAALIAVGIVVAAAVYARFTAGHALVGHPSGSTGGSHVVPTQAGSSKPTRPAAPPHRDTAATLATGGATVALRGGGGAGDDTASTAVGGSSLNGSGSGTMVGTVATDELLRRREAELQEATTALEEQRKQLSVELERISGMSASRAKQLLLETVEDEARHDAARRIRQIEEETRREAERRVRNILSVCMQRLAAGHAAETTVSVVQLPADDMKGRIIGREGRNIRVLENLTGVDFIIDDTPGAVVLSGFDGVRREVARLTLEKLLADGRIHPARIEETYYQSRSELEAHIVELGDEGAFEAGVQGLNPELITLLGKLKFRTSYGQNVLAHSIEVARLAAMMADELGASARTARRAALLHDVGKAVTHEIEGPHALVAGELMRKYGESEAVAHAVEAHHNEVEPQTIEAVIVQAADALSGARPGARGESLEQYVKRLRDLEEIATRHAGVEKVYAMQAGREIRVMVVPGAVDDDAATVLSFEIAREIEKRLEYPGQIKVTVIRESRAIEYAR
jgi:ribonucrease Y